MRYDRVVALARSEQHESVIGAVNEFTDAHPDHPLQPDAQYLLIEALHRLDQHDASRNAAGDFLASWPTHDHAASVTFLAAEDAFLLGDFADAVDRFRAYLNHDPAGPHNVAARYRLGVSLCRLDRVDTALPLLAEITEVDDDVRTYPTAALMLGDLYMQRESWSNAESAFSRYLLLTADDAPARDDAMFKIGLARQRRDRFADALDVYTRLISSYSRSEHVVQALFERGQCHLSLNDDEAAAADFELVLDADDDRFRRHALRHLGAIRMRQGDLIEAASIYARLAQAVGDENQRHDALLWQARALSRADRHGDAEAVLATLVSNSSDRDVAAEALARLAIARARQDRHADALQSMDQLLPHLGRLDPSLVTTLRYEQAWSCRALEQYEAAIGAYRALLDINGAPLDTRAHAALELGELLASQRRHAEAIPVLTSLLDQQLDELPASERAVLRPQALYRLGAVGYADERYELCVNTLEHFITEYPEHELAASASLLCGEAHYQRGAHQDAIGHLTRLADIDCEDELLRPALLRLGEAHAALQQWSPSIDAFDRFLERFPDAPQRHEARFGRGFALENRGQFRAAIQVYQSVIDGHDGPTAARAQFQIGECLYALDRHEDAARELLKVDILYGYPEWSAAALFEAGRCFEALERPDDATAQYRQVVDQHAATDWARLARQRLDVLAPASLPGRS
jgi:TolA-binding protein